MSASPINNQPNTSPKHASHLDPQVDRYVYRYIAYLADSGYHFNQTDREKLARHAENEMIAIPVSSATTVVTTGLLYVLGSRIGGRPLGNKHLLAAGFSLYGVLQAMSLCKTGVQSWWKAVNYDGLSSSRFPSFFNISDTMHGVIPAEAKVSQSELANKVRAALRTYYPQATGIFQHDLQFITTEAQNSNVTSVKDVSALINTWRKSAIDPSAPTPETLRHIYPSFCSVYVESNMMHALRGQAITATETVQKLSQMKNPSDHHSDEPAVVSAQSSLPPSPAVSSRPLPVVLNNPNVPPLSDDPFELDPPQPSLRSRELTVTRPVLRSTLPPEELEKRRIARQARAEERKRRAEERIATIRSHSMVNNSRPIRDLPDSDNLTVDPNAPKPIAKNSFGDPIFGDVSMNERF